MAVKQNFQKVIQNYEINYQEIAKKILEDRSSNNSYRATALLREAGVARNFDNKFKIQAQDEFIKSLKKATYTKLQLMIMDYERLNDKKAKDSTDIKKDVRQQLSKGSSKSGNVESVVKSVEKKDGSENELINKKDQKLQDGQLKSETLKAMYDLMLEKYYNLRLEVNRELNEHGKLNPRDRIYSEYLEYENYLRKIDVTYKKQNGRYIALDDDGIKQKEQKYLRKDMQAEYKTQDDVANSVMSIKKIQDEIQDINGQIVKQYQKLESGQITKQIYYMNIDTLQQQLMDKTDELGKTEPSQDELNKYFEKSTDYDNKKDRILGQTYNEFKQNKVIDSDGKLYSIDLKSDVKESSSLDTSHDEAGQTVDTTNKAIESVQKAQEVGDAADDKKDIRRKGNIDLPVVDTPEKQEEQLEELRKQSEKVEKEIDNSVMVRKPKH